MLKVAAHAGGGLVVLAAAVLGACGPDWRAKVPPRYRDVAEVHRAHCGSCHTRVEPGERTRPAFEAALAGHHGRVKLSDADWALLIDYLTHTPPP